MEELELYFQDTWRARPGLAITAGLRWSFMPPVREVNGLQVSITSSLDQHIANRMALAESGRPSREAGPIGRPIFLFGLRHLIEVDSHSHVLSSR